MAGGTGRPERDIRGGRAVLVLRRPGKLSVSGHLTIFVARTRGPFWTRPAPAPVLLGAVVGTQLIAACIAVYGAPMTP
jgi:hypothetical protein